MTSDVTDSGVTEYVTAMIGEQMFGMPIGRVQDVFIPEHLTRVPLANRDIAGVLNLRGRIVTAINMRALLGLENAETAQKPIAIGVEASGESFGLLIDGVGEVLTLSNDTREVNPVNLDSCLSAMAGGVYRLDGKLMVVLDVDRVLESISKKH